MKKHLKIIGLIVVITTMATMLTGCGETRKAETVINNAFTALKALDLETASAHINIDKIFNDISESDDKKTDELSLDGNVFAQNLFGKMEYEIISSEKVDKNTVIVKTKITSVNMKPVLAEYIAAAFQFSLANAFANPQPTEEEQSNAMEKILNESFTKVDLEMITNEVDIKVINVDNEWKIESSDELANALLGGLPQVIEDMADSFAEIEQ